MNGNYFMSLVGAGLVVGSLYGFLAVGFAVIFKATRVVNFAQGELMMLIAYLAYSISTYTGVGFWGLIPCTIAAAIAIALVIERLLIKPMAGESTFSIVMLTVGLAVCIRSLCVLIWGAEPLGFPNRPPDNLVTLAGVRFTEVQLAAVATFTVYCAALWIFLGYSRFGLAMRAVAQSEATAMLMGISVRRVAGTAWAIAAVGAGLAGLFVSSLYDLAPDIYSFGIRAFPASILGGLDSVAGAVVSGLAVAVFENFGEATSARARRKSSASWPS